MSGTAILLKRQDGTVLTDVTGAPMRLRGPAGPVGHDFPYRTCVYCRFPIAPADLVDDDYRPRHRSTCSDGAGSLRLPAVPVAERARGHCRASTNDAAAPAAAPMAMRGDH